MPGERGFTLIELVVVLAIIGLTVALTMPMIGARLSGTALDAGVQELRVTLRDARVAAVAGGRDIAFRGDPAGGYWLDGRHRGFRDGLRIATAAPIAFFATGGSSGGRVFVGGAAGRRELVVDTLTGRASLAP